MSDLTRAEAIMLLTAPQFEMLRLKPGPVGPASFRLAIANSKGGVGKSTTAVNMADAFTRWGWRVRIIDADAQGGSATKWVPADAVVRGTLLDVYLGNADLSEVTCTTNLAKVSIVPSNKSLAQANSQNPPVSEHVLLDALEEDVERNGDEVANDLEVIDTTPALSTLMVTSLVLATHVAIPMNLGELDLEGLRELRDLVATVQRRANPNLKIIAVIITRDQPNTLLARELRQTLAEELPGVLIAPIPSSVRIMEMAGYQESVFTVDAKGSGALASWRLAAHLAEAMGCTWEVAPEDVVSKDKVKKA